MQGAFVVPTIRWGAKDNGSTLIQEDRDMALASAIETEFFSGNDAQNCC